MTSCYSTYSVYKGNVHQQTIGKTKNEILRSYGVPNQITSDGAGGEVLVYEVYTQTTITNSSGATKSGSSTAVRGVYGNGGIIIGSQTRGTSVSSANTISQTSVDKTYCNLYLNADNVVYDFQTNYGAQYDYYRCFDKKLTWIGVGVSCLAVWPVIVTVPWAIIAQKKAKEKGIICK